MSRVEPYKTVATQSEKIMKSLPLSGLLVITLSLMMLPAAAHHRV
jgi:hypothetical protein